MKVILTNSDIKTLLLESFAGGLTELRYAECFIDWDNPENDTNYDKAKALIVKEQKKGTFKGIMGSDTICSEDILLKMTEKYGVVFQDECHPEGLTLTFKSAKENLQKAIDEDKEGWFMKQVNQILPEYDDADAWTYFHILQGALFSEVIYG